MIMRLHTVRKSRGFSLIELLLAMALGLILLGSATQLFKNGMDASRMVSQRTEMQDNVRAAVNLISRDVTLAGSGMPNQGMALPYGPGNSGPSAYGKDPVTTWVTSNTYPTGNFGTPPAAVDNYMYNLIPGPAQGMQLGGPATIPATNQKADRITSIYTDYVFPLYEYNATFADNTGTKINFAVPVPAPPTPIPAAINGPGGIQVGDLILISASGKSAIGEVTNLGKLSLTFAPGDTLNVNQTGIGVGGGGNILSLCNPGPTCVVAPLPIVITAYRVYAVTYFIQVPVIAGQLPKLMRQVDGHPAQPVADDIIGLKFTYDVCNGTITPGVNPNCAGISNLFANGFTPNDVNKVNISVMGQSLLSYGNHAQNMQMTASVSTRDLTFKDRYQ